MSRKKLGQISHKKLSNQVLTKILVDELRWNHLPPRQVASDLGIPTERVRNWYYKNVGMTAYSLLSLMRHYDFIRQIILPEEHVIYNIHLWKHCYKELTNQSLTKILVTELRCNHFPPKLVASALDIPTERVRNWYYKKVGMTALDLLFLIRQYWARPDLSLFRSLHLSWTTPSSSRASWLISQEFGPKKGIIVPKNWTEC